MAKKTMDTQDEYPGIPVFQFPGHLNKESVVIVVTSKRFHKEIRDILYDAGIGRMQYFY